MDIPVELFMGFIGVSIALAIFGFIRNPQIPAMLVFGGMFMLVLAVSTDNIIISSFLDSGSNTVYHYNIDSFTGQLSLNNGSNTAHAEFVSSSSSMLLNDEINCIDVLLRKTGLPLGTATIGTLDSNGNIVQQFGTINVATLTTANIWYSFCLAGDNTYIIQNQDRLGISFNGGDATNNIQISQNANNPFDGVITFRQQYNIGWTSGSTSDLTMRFYLTGLPQEIVKDVYEFTELPKVLFGLISVIFMLAGGLMVARNQ